MILTERPLDSELTAHAFVRDQKSKKVVESDDEDDVSDVVSEVSAPRQRRARSVSQKPVATYMDLDDEDEDEDDDEEEEAASSEFDLDSGSD